MGKRELIALLNLSSWCLVMVEWLFLAVPWGCLRFVIVVFPDHTTYYFYMLYMWIYKIFARDHFPRPVPVSLRRNYLCKSPWALRNYRDLNGYDVHVG